MKRWPVIRHIRYWVLSIKFALWWGRAGRHLGAFPNPNDIEYLNAVWRGKA